MIVRIVNARLILHMCRTDFLRVPGVPLYRVVHLVGQHIARVVAQVVRHVEHIAEGNGHILYRSFVILFLLIDSGTTQGRIF